MMDRPQYILDIEQKIIAIEEQAKSGGNNEWYDKLEQDRQKLSESINKGELPICETNLIIQLFDRCACNIAKYRKLHVGTE